MKAVVFLAALLGLVAGIVACCVSPLHKVHPSYIVERHEGFVPAASEFEITVTEGEVVLEHVTDSGTLRVHYTKVEQTSP